MNGVAAHRMGRADDLVFAAGRIVLADRVLDGSVRIGDGRIAAIDEGPHRGIAIDLEGDYLIPGLIELHTDNLERHYQPRAGVFWDPVHAVIAHDAQVIGAGITTVFDSMAIGVNQGWDGRAEMVGVLSAAVVAAQDAGMLKAEHRLHLRCEVTDPHIVPTLEGYLGHPLLALMSLMDHAPGDRQSPSIEGWRRFHLKYFDFDEAALTRYQEELIQHSRTLGPHHRRRLGEIAATRSIPLASHDDASAAHIEEAVDLGAALTEFPTTVEAAAAAHRHGLRVLMGSPNLVRGASHSGNVAAAELAALGLLDILSSDYIPASLLPAAFRLADEPFGLDLGAAVQTVTLAPAEAVGMADRGAIAVGKRADLLRVHVVDGRPLVRSVWLAGERVA